MYQRFLIFVLGCLFSAVSAAAMLPPLDKLEAFKAITIEGEDIPAAVGSALEDLSLAAVVDNGMEPVPFQIDQYNRGGALYFKDWDVPLAGDAKRFDTTDKLLFLFKDAGPRRTANDVYDGEIVAEILLEDNAGIERFVYLVKGSRLRSEEQYVRYSAEMGLVETDFYQMRYNRENHLKWEDFAATNFVGERPLDSLKLSLNMGAVTSLIPMELDNDDLVAVPKGENIGPIRTTTQLDLTMYYLQVPIMHLSMQVHHYPKFVLYDVRGIIPGFRRMLMNKPYLNMSLDANRLMGATVRMANGPKEPGIVDGKISALEEQMRKTSFTKDDNWYWVSTLRNMDVVAFLNYLDGFDEPVSPYIQDDLDSFEPPEIFPGQLPNLGYTIHSFPEQGFMGVVVSIYLDDSMSGDPDIFTKQLRTLPEIQVRSVMASAQ
ncbi:MAG TPA: hypothetical protein VM553_06100 [Dongiaceae bacterium]|nr:hypothetical protein [Dongiaceae bacterium]